MVNNRGERFMNEANPSYMTQLITMVDDGDYPYWTVYDQVSDAAAEFYDSGLATGTVVKGDTLAEAAGLAGLPVQTLLDSVARYNEMAAKGVTTTLARTPAT